MTHKAQLKNSQDPENINMSKISKYVKNVKTLLPPHIDSSDVVDQLD